MAVLEITPLRPGSATSSPVVFLVLLALNTNAGLRLILTSLATVLALPRSVNKGKGTGGATPGTKQKSGTIKTTLNLLSLRAILLMAIGRFCMWAVG